MSAIRILEAVALASLNLAFINLSRRFLGSAAPGLLGATLAILAHVQLEFWHTAQPEVFGGVALAWALVCITSPTSSTRSPAGVSASRLTVAGALFMLAFLLKPPLGAPLVTALLVSAGFAIRSEPAMAFSRTGRMALFLCLGAFLPLALTIFYFWDTGALSALYDVLFRYAPHYTAIDLNPTWLVEYVFRAVEQWLFWFSPYYFVGTL